MCDDNLERFLVIIASNIVSVPFSISSHIPIMDILHLFMAVLLFHFIQSFFSLPFSSGSFSCYNIKLIESFFRGAWVAQSAKHPTLAQVTISRFMGPSLASGSETQSLEPVLDSVSFSPSSAHTFCLSLKINK